MPGFDNPFADSDPISFLSKFTGGAESKILDMVGKHPMAVTMLIAVLVVLSVVLIIAIVVMMNKSGFRNGRIAGSGSGRNNQLYRAQQFELPLSQPELDAFEEQRYRDTGMQYMNQYDPPMENVYSGFGDSKINPTVETPQLRPQYPEGGYQESFNQNVLNNIAYD